MELLALPKLANVITVMVAGVCIAVIFFLFRKLMDAFGTPGKNFPILGRVRPVLETIVWFGFLLWMVQHLFQSQPLAAYVIYGVLIIGIGLSSRFTIQEAVIGVIFKMEQHIHIGDRIQTGAVQGVVQRIGYRYLEIKTDSRQVAILPYSELVRQVFIKIGDASAINTQTLTLEIPKKENLQTSLEKVKALVHNSIWVSLKPEPKINLMTENEMFYTISITFSVISPDYFNDVEQLIRHEMVNP